MLTSIDRQAESAMRTPICPIVSTYTDLTVGNSRRTTRSRPPLLVVASNSSRIRHPCHTTIEPQILPYPHTRLCAVDWTSIRWRNVAC